MIDSDVVNIPVDVFSNAQIIAKLAFKNPEAMTPALTIANAVFFHGQNFGGLTETVVLPNRLTTLGNSVFKGQAKLKKVVFGSNQTTVGLEAFGNTTALVDLDLRKATSLVSIRKNAFKDGGLKNLYIGKATKVLNKGSNDDGLFGEMLSTTADQRVVHFKGDDDVYLEATERGALETAWVKLKESANGSWKFFADKEDTPNPVESSDKVALEGLNGADKYHVTVKGSTTTGEEVAATDGKITIKQEWKGKTIQIYKRATKAKLESDVKEVNISTDTVAPPVSNKYKVTVDGTEKYTNLSAGDNVELTTVPEKNGKAFVKWAFTPETVAVKDPTKLTVLFKMPEEDVVATTTYLDRGTTPAATVDYASMNLKSLTQNAKYSITPDGGEVGEFTADQDGAIALKKDWSEKTLKIVAKATQTVADSLAQDVEALKKISTLIVEGEERLGAEGENITIKAQVPEGYLFQKWAPVGVTIPDTELVKEEATFVMPGQEAQITAIYKKVTAAPTARVDYTSMKLTGLVANAVYSITPDSDQAEELVADGEGAIALKKAWSEKVLKIVKKETEEGAESPAQSLAALKKIFTITVDDKELLGAEGENITIKALAPAGYLFEKWNTPAGVTIPEADLVKSEITFTVPSGDVKLTATYKQVVTNKPDELVYDGGKEVSVKLEITRAEFKGIKVGDKDLVENTDYTITEDTGVATLAGGIIVTFTKAYLDKLENGDQAFKVVLQDNKEVDFAIKVEKPATPEVPEKPAKVYPDVKESDWFHGAVGYVDVKGYMTGYANGNFGPADVIQRGQFATILHRIGGSPVVEYSNAFADVQDGHFYSLPVVWAKSKSYITGYENGNFGPADSITREQLATMLYRHATIKKEGNVAARADLNKFPDAASVSAFAKDALSWAVAQGIISGDQGKLNPQGESSRAVAATMIQRLEKVNAEAPAA